MSPSKLPTVNVYLKKNAFLFIFDMINYFQTFQTAVFYKKNLYEMFKRNLNMFLDLPGSCDQYKNVSQEKLTIGLWSQKFDSVASFGLGIRQ